jgi:hypothetical protein
MTRPYNTNIIDRFLSHLENDGDCIIWTAGKNNSGYGWIMGRRKPIGVHVFSYELHSGKEVISNYEPHHKCHNKLCVKFEHLELLTTKNNLRANHEICKNGHQIIDDNILYEKGKRRCKKCRLAYRKRYYKEVQCKTL